MSELCESNSGFFTSNLYQHTIFKAAFVVATVIQSNIKNRPMNNTIRNIFGVAAAILVMLGVNEITDSNTIKLPSYDTHVTSAENRPVNSFKDFNDAIVDIAEKTNPAVVMITTEKVQQRRVMQNPFSQFFGNPYGGDSETREYTQRGLGSGVIVSDEGYIITNNHVIADVDEIEVQLYNGESIKAELVGADPATDIAVLKVDIENLPTVKLGNSDHLKVGSFVLAIGSPLSENLAHTVSFGIVSAKQRSIGLIGQGAGFEDFIQTDAAINPGNSGGALIDMNGELVGINSAIASRSGGNDGIGFAIPINLAKRIMDDLVDDGEVSRGYLGLYFGGEVDRTMAKALGIDDARGFIVARVEEDGPAAKAGLQEQDVVVSIDGEKVTNWTMFRSKIGTMKPGEKVELGILRDGDSKTIQVTLGEREEEMFATTEPAKVESMEEKIGFNVSDLTDNFRRQLQLDSDVEGIVVTDIKQSSNAYERGLRKGDVITAVKRNKVKTETEFFDELEKISKSGDEVVLLTVMQRGVKQYIAFEL